MKSVYAFTIFLSLSVYSFSTSAQQNTFNDAQLIDFYQNQRFAEAAAYLKNSFSEPVTDLKILSRFAYANQMAGKLPEAESYYLRIYNQDSTSIPVLLNLASIQARRQNNTKALFYYEKVIAIDKSNFSVYKQLGKLYLDKSDDEAAIKNLQLANRIRQDEADVAADLSLLLINKKQEIPAGIVLKRALAADSTNILLLHCLAKLTYVNERFKQTIQTCIKLMELDDQSGEVLNMLATSYFMLKNYECAIETFAMLPELSQTERTYYLTARSYKGLKRYKTAVSFYDKTLSAAISPNTDVYYDEMADTYGINKQFRSAAAAYQKGLFFKDKPITYYMLACLYDTDLNDKKSAVKYFKKYLSTKPPVKQEPYISYTKSRITELSK